MVLLIIFLPFISFLIITFAGRYIGKIGAVALTLSTTLDCISFSVNNWWESNNREANYTLKFREF
jgi:hypothetical protein